MTVLTSEAALADIRKLFVPATNADSRFIGAEIEVIPTIASTGERLPTREGNPSGHEFIGSLAKELGWREEPMGDDPSSWIAGGARITFEPGGQLEVSSAVYPSVNALMDALDGLIGILVQRAKKLGIELRTIGIEDRIGIDQVSLQLHSERYTRMTEYLETIGPFGVLMMRQTASLQINVDRGTDPLGRWRLLNALAPYLIAIFANSPRYSSKHTGHKSYRAHVWRNLDPKRTGIVYSPGNEAERYCDFALDAPIIFRAGPDNYATPRHLLASGTLSRDEWEMHLTTLFPEIRPRDYFEIRSIDAIAPAHFPAAFALVVGLVYDADSAARALEILGLPDTELLVTAGRYGLDNTALREMSTRLVRLALQGCERIGEDYISRNHVLSASRFFDEYTLKGKSPNG